MSKGKFFDYELGVQDIIPSSRTVYFNKDKDHTEGPSERLFNNNAVRDIKSDIKDSKTFPLKGNVLVFIVQYFVSEKSFYSQDVDNMARTILNILKSSGILSDDGQVKTLVFNKRIIDNRIKTKFAYIGIKKLNTREPKISKVYESERALNVYQQVIQRINS